MRKIITYTAITGRDKGKTFRLTEMPARQAHKWATKAIFAVMNAGLDVPDEYADAGFAGLAAIASSGGQELMVMLIKTLGKINIQHAEPLLDELLECVEIIPDSKNAAVVRRLFEEDIEEVSTIFTLQKEVLVLHMGFFTAGSQ